MIKGLGMTFVSDAGDSSFGKLNGLEGRELQVLRGRWASASIPASSFDLWGEVSAARILAVRRLSVARLAVPVALATA